MDPKREKPTLPNGRGLLGPTDNRADESGKRIRALLDKAKSMIKSGKYEDAIEMAKTARVVAASNGLPISTEARSIYRIANAKAGISHLDTFLFHLQKFPENSSMRETAAKSLRNMHGYVTGSGADTSVFDKLSDSVNRLRKIPSEPPMK